MKDGTRPTRLVDALLCVVTFVVIAVIGWAIHVFVLPVPIVSPAAIAARFLYFLLWLAALTYLLGRAILGRRSSGYHIIVFVLVGILLGIQGGYFFAGPMGMLVGMVSGPVIVGPVVFILRHRHSPNA